MVKAQKTKTKHKKLEPFDILMIVIASFAALIIIFPLYYVVSLSFSSYTQYIKSSGFVLIPNPISLDGYKQFLTNQAVPRAFLVTIFITVVGTLLNFMFTVTLAYPLSRRELPFRKFLAIYTFLPMIFSGGLIPTFYVVKRLGLMNTVWAMIMPILITTYNLTITRSFFQSIDDAYIEVGRIEGMNEVQILFHVIVPLAKPVIATIILMYGVMHWNTYYHALYYVRSSNLQPLQVVLKGILMKAQSTLEETSLEVTASTQAMKQAAVVITALPVVLVYPFLQKYFTKGMLIGGIKG